MKRIGLVFFSIGIIGTGLAAFSSYSTRPPERAASKDIIVAVHYAPWFKGTADIGWTQWVGTKKVHTAYTPLLGYYDNRTRAVLSTHIEWATAYGIDAFMIEWWGLPSGKFRAGIDDVVRPFLANPDFKKIKFFFVYSFVQALRKDGEPTFPVIDLDDAERVAKLVSDFKYVARTYFNQPNQLKIGGKPVVYLWAISSSKGNFKVAMTKLRNAVKAVAGTDLYIIGDELGFGGTPDLVRTPCLDAVMPYMMIKGGKPIRNYKIEATIDDIESQYRTARNVCADLGVKFIPLGFAGFNAVGAPWCYDDAGKLATPVVARSVSGFKSFVQKAKEMIDPDLRMFYITSWSEWNEGTNIEPSREFNFDYLKVVKSELSRFTPSPLPDTVKFAFKRVWNPSGPDDRLLAAAFDKVEFLDAQGKVLLKLDIGTNAARAYMGIGFSGNETGTGEVKNFCWAEGRLKFATLHLGLPAGASSIRFKVWQIPNQSIDLFLNGKKLGSFPVQTPWQWTLLESKLK